MTAMLLPSLLLCGAALEPIDVDDGRQLLLDHRFLAESQGIELRVHPPVKRGPVVVRDRPWEGKDIGFCVSVAEYEGRYMMWYMARTADGAIRQCLALSDDGVRWEKPSLGVVEFEGSRDNNIVLDGIIETTVFVDPVAAPEARFKAVSSMNWPDPATGGLYIHTSPDGIHWRKGERRVLPFCPDTANQAFYDTRLGRYVANIRVWDPMRKVGRVEMDDITEPWPFTPVDPPNRIWGPDAIPVTSREVPVVFGYDELDPVPSDHYNAACVQYPWAQEAYFLFPSAYRHFPDPPAGKYGNDGLLDIQLAVSRDGVAWERPTREPYVGLGLEGGPEGGQLYMAVGMLRRGDALLQYYGGYSATHGAYDAVDADGAIFLAEQRLDGFVSATAGPEGGSFTTPPLTFAGSSLSLNLDAGAMGACRAALLTEEGAPLPGFGLEDCDELGGNSVSRLVSWHGSADLSAFTGRAIRLRFATRSASLYSFAFGSP